MKILWLCNIMPVQVAKQLQRPVQNVCGWMNILADVLEKDPEVELAILFPISKKQSAVQGNAGKISYYSFFQNMLKPERYDYTQESFFDTVLDITLPNVIHIWGSEYPHTLAMINSCAKKGLLSQTVISIQGLVSVCAIHYYAGLPLSALIGKTFRDLIRQDGIRTAKKKFKARGQYEIKAIQKVNHVIGRTEWDFSCVKRINPNIFYHYGNEILRPAFYGAIWRLEKCQKHSIFISQWGYPLKGFHMFLEAFKELIKEYPDVQLITTGKNLLKASKKEQLKQTYYDRYLIKLIKKWNLYEHIVFLGSQLNEEEMQAQYLRAHVFVLPSAIENSPNSMGEAMLLGTPVVASNVGGINSMLTHKKEGFTYPFDEPYMAAYYIKCIFQNDALAKKLSIAARKRAAQTHDIQKNIDTYYQIYESIS